MNTSERHELVDRRAPGRAELRFATARAAIRAFRQPAGHCAAPATRRRTSGPGPRSPACARGHAHAVVRQPVVERRHRARPRPRPAGRAPARPAGTPSCCSERRVHPGARRLRVARPLQRRRAAHERVGEIDRHVGDALDAGNGLRRRLDFGYLVRQQRRHVSARQARIPHLLRGIEVEPGQAQQVAEHAQHLPAGRASPSGRTEAVEALHAAFGADEGAGGLGERRDRQQHVADIGLERRQVDDELRAIGDPGVCAIELRVEIRAVPGLFYGQVPASPPAGRQSRDVAADAVGRFAEEPDLRARNLRDRLRGGVDGRGLRMLLREVAEQDGRILSCF